MCGVCGCNEGEVRIGGAAGRDPAGHDRHSHPHHDHHHHHDASHDESPVGSQWLHIEQDILAKNGFVTMRADGMDKVKGGLTTPGEVFYVSST